MVQYLDTFIAQLPWLKTQQSKILHTCGKWWDYTCVNQISVHRQGNEGWSQPQIKRKMQWEAEQEKFGCKRWWNRRKSRVESTSKSYSLSNQMVIILQNKLNRLWLWPSSCHSECECESRFHVWIFFLQNLLPEWITMMNIAFLELHTLSAVCTCFIF